ncbi:hypothetical protein ESCAB7627_4387 [Escherichia albertii TW07627]|uniref:Uncharacterized protein n=2 Tax=Escherichia albertii TaxID=208962 RepID=A0ABC9NT07_ESCAT|nr:hypothetical protein EAKF1_ch2557c [Escherichia albertii KF1]EDS93311.1 hypothetical protein ESCAB7627_4387 [Escherichia albertii TW07627]OSL28563.1 hypothetical protein EAPG_04019 [Escherichia albertii B156]
MPHLAGQNALCQQSDISGIFIPQPNSHNISSIFITTLTIKTLTKH